MSKEKSSELVHAPSIRDEANEKASFSSLAGDQIGTLASLSPSTHSDNPFFVPNLEYTSAEEAEVRRCVSVQEGVLEEEQKAFRTRAGEMLS